MTIHYFPSFKRRYAERFLLEAIKNLNCFKSNINISWESILIQEEII